jgi:hypothetical protein
MLKNGKHKREIPRTEYRNALHNDVSVTTDRIYDGGLIRLQYNIIILTIVLQ